MLPRPPTSTLFPYTTLFRSGRALVLTKRIETDIRAVASIPSAWYGSVDVHWTSQRLRAGGYVQGDRKSTRLNSSHPSISYAVFCLKKKKNNQHPHSLKP